MLAVAQEGFYQHYRPRATVQDVAALEVALRPPGAMAYVVARDATSGKGSGHTSMANLSDDSDAGVSLFPMFNILACTLGVLVFILATVATVSLGADKAVEFTSVAASGTLQSRVPTWLEWDGTEMVLYPDGARVRFERDLGGIPTFELTYAYMFDQVVGTRVGAELAAVSLDGSRFIVLLVRPSGFGTLPEIRGYLDLLGIDVVAEPIDQSLRRIRVR